MMNPATTGTSRRRPAARSARLALLLTAALVGACEKSVPARQRAPLPVEVMRVAREPFTDTIRVNGQVVPLRVVRVAAEVSGRVEAIGGKEGERVTAGSNPPIVRLNTDLLQAAYDRAEAEAASDRREYERLKGLSGGLVAEKNLALAKAAADMSAAALKEAKARLVCTAVRAPISGTLDDIAVEIGSYVQAGQVVAEIVDDDRVKVVVFISQRDIAFLNVGDPVTVEYKHRDRTETRPAAISFISRLSEAESLTTRIEIEMDNRSRRLRSRMFVYVRFTRRRLPAAVMIPLDAVIPTEAGYMVYVAADGRAKASSVRLGLKRGKSVQVLDGLEADDMLIVKGHRYAGPGQELKITAPPATRPAR